jgi:tRNA(Arg) A34 adenosine deaminase TadA
MIASGEPCPMCATAMIWAGITHIIFAAAKPDIDAILPDGPRINLRCADITNCGITRDHRRRAD